MSEIEVMQVTPLKLNFNVECEGCGDNDAQFTVKLREYQDGAFQGIGREDEFDYCSRCRINALDRYSDYLQKENRHVTYGR